MTSPVLKPPKELEEDPAIREAFKQTKKTGTGDPETFNKWFAASTEKKRKQVVGIRRYKEVQQLVPDREPEWSDFIDEEGNLLPIKDLKNETMTQRVARKELIDRQIERRGRAIRELSRRGFEWPKAKKRKNLSKLRSSGRIDIEDAGAEFRSSAKQVLPGLTPRKFADMAGVPGGGNVQVSVSSSERRDFLGINGSFAYDRDGITVEGYTSLVSNGRDRPFLMNRNIRIDPPKTGAGADLLYSQAVAARKMGVRKIRMLASRTDDEVGYKVWPKLGFNAEIPEELRAEVNRMFPGVRTLAGLIRSQDGSEWWDENGIPVYLEFNTNPKSRDFKRLKRHLKQKEAEMKKSKTGSATESKKTRMGPMPKNVPVSEMLCRAPHLSEEDDRIFEQMRIEDEQDENFVDEIAEPMMDWEREAMDMMIRGEL